MAERYKRNPNTQCSVCKKPVYRRPAELIKTDGRAYCNQICYGTACRKEVPCVVCGKSLLSRFNKKTCSRACSNKHRSGIKYKIGRPKDKAFDTASLKMQLFDIRGARCERCGYDTKEILHLHHRDRNRKNNTAENLEIVCPNCHYLEHYLESSQVKKYGGVA